MGMFMVNFCPFLTPFDVPCTRWVSVFTLFGSLFTHFLPTLPHLPYRQVNQKATRRLPVEGCNQDACNLVPRNAETTAIYVF